MANKMKGAPTYIKEAQIGVEKSELEVVGVHNQVACGGRPGWGQNSTPSLRGQVLRTIRGRDHSWTVETYSEWGKYSSRISGDAMKQCTSGGTWRGD